MHLLIMQRVLRQFETDGKGGIYLAEIFLAETADSI
jgi:hypothetical protein